MATIGHNIEERRVGLDMTQAQLAEALPVRDGRTVTQPLVSEWESGEKCPSVGRVNDLCEALHCTPNDLMDM
ncbi:MAG TPA: helix-turn-helix transcriptional regulator [Phycisphaerae bacterium]|nr:helix-turn-helix transcriptional regulator [Phycisphaerae bacterium]